MTDDDLVRLYEAMGWTSIIHEAGWPPIGIPSDSINEFGVRVKGSQRLPDPRTDANADYAVLECAHVIGWQEFKAAIAVTVDQQYKWNYQIGDYARAALKVIDQ